MECQNSKISFKKCVNIAVTEYVKWICHPKMSLLLIMFVFIYDMVIVKMLNAGEEMHQSIMFLEPFIAIGNSPLLVLILPSVFIALMGDFPRIDGNSMFYIQRSGKNNWMLGQMIFSFFASLTYIVSILLCSIVSVCFRCSFHNGYSDVTTRYVKVFPEKSQSMVANFITARLYNNIPPIKACLLSASLTVLYMMLISDILMTGFVMKKRSVVIGFLVGYICVGTAVVQFNIQFKWLFTSAHMLPWLHYDDIYRFQKFRIEYSYLFFVMCIVMFYLLNTILIHQCDFSKIEDIED